MFYIKWKEKMKKRTKVYSLPVDTYNKGNYESR